MRTLHNVSFSSKFLQSLELLAWVGLFLWNPSIVNPIHCHVFSFKNSGQKINIQMAKWGPQGQNTALLSILMCKAAYLSYQELLILPRIDFSHANYVDHKMIRNITVRKESIKEDTSTLIQKICIL